MAARRDSMMAAICGVGVTSSMLWQPFNASSSMAPAKASRSTAFPILSRLIWWFWQKGHFRLQEVKKRVPAPPVPEMGGSSPKWGRARERTASGPRPQNPVFPSRRLTRHSRGQRVQLRINSRSTGMRSPEEASFRGSFFSSQGSMVPPSADLPAFHLLGELLPEGGTDLDDLAPVQDAARGVVDEFSEIIPVGELSAGKGFHS